jgi:hypothetical protein
LQKRQIENYVAQILLARNSPRKDETLKDITDGMKYRSMRLNGNDLSCSFNTDGVPAFKSSKFSIWPILISLNELPYNVRYRNVVIAALWVGDIKPNFSAFFPPFVNMCKRLSSSESIR